MTHRLNIIEVLTDFAAKGAQIDWHRCGKTNIPGFLFERWEKFFTPTWPEFEQQFTQREIEQLNRFEEFYMVRKYDFPEAFDELLRDAYWNSVCEFAAELVEELSANGDVLDKE